MGAGKYNRRVAFQSSTINHDSYNTQITTWAVTCTVWGAVAEVGSKELYQAQKLHSETAAVFIVRYSQRINSRMRIVYGGRTFEILGVTQDSKRTELVIAAKEVAL